MAIPVEEIAADQTLSRLIFFPSMYKAVEGLVWKEAFQFPTNQGQKECLVWARYAPLPNGTHQIGIDIETERKGTKSDSRYEGYISAIAGDITTMRNARGHGFNVIHNPVEGDHHVDILFKASANTNLTKNDRNELKAKLRTVFGPLVRSERASA